MTNTILDKIQNRLWHDKQPVTARWVCYEYICQMTGAQEVLRECKDANEGKLAITWLIEGIATDSGHRAVRVVPDSQAADAKQNFSEVLSEQIYSLTPSVGAPDASSLIAGDVEQARQMMAGLLANSKQPDGKVEAFIQNGCSMVKGAPCVREVVKRKQKPPAAPASAQAKKPPLASAFGQAKPKAASAPATASLEKNVKSEAGTQEPAVKAEPVKGAKGKAKASNPLANSFSKSTGKRPAKDQASKPAAKPNNQKQEAADAPMEEADPDEEQLAEQSTAKPKKESQQVLDDDDEEDEMEAQEPLPTKKRAAKARQQMVLEDSDDDFAPSPEKEKTETVPKIASSTKKPGTEAKAANAGKAAKVEAPDSDMEKAEDVTAEPQAVEPKKSKIEVEGKAAEGQGDDVKAHPEHGVPPHPDAEIAMIGSKAVWQYINDKGEEITVEVKKPAAAKPAAVKQQVPSKRAKPEPQEEAGNGADEPKAAKKKKVNSKQQKAAAQASDIRSMFGKKK